MTVKRFTIPKECRYIKDNHTGNDYLCEDRPEANKLARLLNELHEEREYWKQQAEIRFERIRELEEMIE